MEFPLQVQSEFLLLSLTNDWAHWLVLIDYKNGKFIVADSAVSSERTGYWSEKTLLKKRILPKVFGIDNLYAVSVEI